MSKVIELDWDPTPKMLREFGFIALAGFGALALMAWFGVLLFSFGLGGARVPVAGGLAALGGLSALFSFVYPQANKPIYLALSVVTYPIGFVLSYVLMGGLFFLLFAPLGILFRLFGRDSMHRGIEQGSETYWRKARPARPRERYFRQF